jgi:hypothetical protein
LVSGAPARLVPNGLDLSRDLIESAENLFASLFQVPDLANQLPANGFRRGSSLLRHGRKV